MSQGLIRKDFLQNFQADQTRANLSCAFGGVSCGDGNELPERTREFRRPVLNTDELRTGQVELVPPRVWLY